MSGAHIAPVMAAVLLAGCTAAEPMQSYSTAPLLTPGWSYSNGDDYYARPSPQPSPVFRPPPVYSSPPAQHSFSFIPRAEAAPAPQPQEAAPPLRAVDPPYSHEIDQSCGHW